MGRKVSARNIAKPTTKPIADPSENTEFANSRSGSTGSAARRSVSAQPTPSTTAAAASATTCHEPHGKRLPAHVVISTRQTPAPASSAVPR